MKRVLISETELLAVHNRLEAATLHRWIAIGVVTPARRDAGFEFDETDAARVHLACDLCYDMGLHDEGLSLVLSLVDQLHRTRHALRALGAAVSAQPDEVRRAVTEHARSRMAKPTSGAAGASQAASDDDI